MNELSLIRAIQRYTAKTTTSADLIAGIGDDCAILRPRPNEDLLFTTDFVVEGVHFTRATQTGIDTGWKALARGLSDIAAMGGEPRYALVSLAMAPWTCQNYIRDLYRGMALVGDPHGVQIIGGDLTKTEKLAIDVIVIGAVPRGKAIRRNGAKPGDQVYVTGPLGRAAARKYKDRPQPRLAEGQALRGKATACMDLSDGLAMDLHRLCQESQVAATIDHLPIHPKATEQQALTGGEDYELLVTLPRTLRAQSNLLRIGQIHSGPKGQVTYQDQPLPPTGWDPLHGTA
jgi:thiamine-monophosphate kinase